MQGLLNIRKINAKIHYINRLKIKQYDLQNRYTNFLNTVSKLGINEISLNLIIDIYPKPKANIIINAEKLKYCLSNQEQNIEHNCSMFLSNIIWMS